MVYALFISLIFAGFATAQPPAKTPEPVDATRSLKALAADDKFTSAAGRFTIGLPKDTAEFEPLVPTKESPKESGGKYSWILKEGVITIDYSDDPDLVIKTDKDYAALAEGMRAGVAVFGGTIVSEKVVKLGTYRGYEVKFDSPDKLKGISRTLIVNGRRYMLFGLAPLNVNGAIESITKAFDSFELTASKP